ncbi:protocadherin Fat 4 isoform X2 [Nematostella vectensis]|uniref:protocadherin Fat 4 isoform X2 n=1 Tax=Nematostella vectensis TaxID=45351 RepID=UPI002076E50D|nr:protocadherin Fat 4 isoform X2 [Nematostella vectensis]
MERKSGLYIILVCLWAIPNVVKGSNNIPYITTTNLALRVNENATIGTDIATIQAEDVENDKLTFSLSDTINKILEIGPDSGIIKLKGKVNREIQDNYEFTVYVEDNYNGGGLARRGSKFFFLIVDDYNDNAPVFTEQPYMAKIAENARVGTTILKISAIDADSGTNSQVQYKFSNATATQTPFFSLNSVNGELTLGGPLDFEVARSYMLVVIAEDLGVPKLESRTTVIIEVTDISDMPPRFLQSSYLKEIEENTPIGSTVVTVEARDGDVGINNPILYEIISGNSDGVFTIDSNTGVITVNGSIDAEKTDVFRITVKASEVPDPNSNTTVTVVVTVVDVNDNRPAFLQSVYIFDVREDVALPGRVVSDQLQVTDGDKNPVFRRVLYHLVGADSDKFAIDPTSGTLYINKTLDYEKQINFTFDVVATETDTSEKFSANASVTLTLINVNDNKPMFAKSSYNYTMDEEITPGTHIADITATDADLGTFGALTYELRGGQAAYFSVNADNGTISAAQILDYDTLPQYLFSLVAKDGGGFYQEIAIATVTVTLQDVNDNDPEFTGMPYTSDIAENLPAGTSVFQVTATDKDSGENGRLSFNISAGDDGGHFSINGSGLVTTARELDRETIATYTLAVSAYDHGVSSRHKDVQLTVNVLDENDNTPQITDGLTITTNISEGAGGGTVLLSSIAAVDPDAGSNGQLTYSMSGGDSRFTLNSATGRLQISPTGLDRELKDSYDLIINVTDNGSPPNTNSTTVHVTILDVNDNTPAFDPNPAQSLATYVITVDEGPGTINKSLIDINATDPDADANGKVAYSLSGDEHGFFRLDPVTGELSVRKELDRESPQMSRNAQGDGRFLLDITATDQATPISDRKSATVRVSITVRDINDNSPQFQSQNFETRLSEAARPGSNVIQVSATDQDLEYKGKVIYNITDGDENHNFEISPNGMILTKTALDADREPKYNLTVIASDTGTPPLTSQTYVVIYVDDVNDNDPVFNQSKYAADVLENSPTGTPVLRVHASDRDQGANGNVTYKLTNGNKDDAFSINNVTGEITVAGVIDREAVHTFVLTVQAEDQGEPSSRKTFAEVVITVKDENDNFPQFSFTGYEGEIAENSPVGSTITMKQAMIATDADDGSNKDITYSLSGPGSENFVINASTAVITASPSSSIDRERKATYHLNVTATDGGGKNATARLTVIVTDKNDESPLFEKSMYYVNVSESASRGIVIGRVTATDRDEGINAIIFYSSNGAEAKFYVSRSTGDIIVDSPLDREFKNVYILNVTAANIVAGAQDTTTQVHITVTDVIDDKPYFNSSSLTVKLSENASIGTKVTKITALDKDIGDTISYSIANGDRYGLFTIDNVTGEIRTVAELDRENVTQYELFVQAKDSVNLVSDLLKVVVQVEDVNDNPPVFSMPGYTIEYWEESPEGTSILQVKAIDADIGDNAAVLYSIVENVTDYVTVNAITGVISLGSSQLDREVEEYFNFTIRATDSGVPSKSSTASVAINLVDINDNSPVFNNTDYYAYVRENQPAGTPVLVVTASDKDVGTNAKLSYVLSGVLYTRFAIDPDTGNITTREPLNREETGSYTLTLRAVDSAIRAREGTTRVIITVTDANDHVPQFTQSGYAFSVREDVKVGHTVGRVATTDEDINDNARVRYYISSGNISLMFSVNETTGIISTTSTLDREQNASYTLIITAKDHGIPALESNTSVMITIEDVNDNKPLFSKSVYNVTLRESVFLKTQVVQVVATDPDEGANGQFTYKITAGDTDDVFNIDANTGLITIKAKLDYEKTSLYNLTVSAQDLGTPPLTGACFVEIHVSDVDDNAPVFHKPRYSAELYENVTRGHHVITVNATDIDAEASHKRVYYRIESGNTDSMFLIGEQSGVITLNCTPSGCLDRETHARYELQVAAISRVNLTEQKSLVPAVITVLDVNDNAPRFDSESYVRSVLEDTGPITDATILTVKAQDGDEGESGEIIFTIVSGNENGVFQMDNKTGVLTRTRPLDREDTSFYSLVVMAEDKGEPALSSSVTVNITVLDMNDNLPILQTPMDVLIPENATIGTLITQLNASDRDTGPFGQLTFAIISGNDEGSFTLNETTGEIRTAKALDHERISQYKLTVKALDKGTPRLSSGEKQVNIFLIDLNDNKPIFTVRRTTFSVEENLDAGVPVGVVAAQDLDTKNLIYYYITNTEEQKYFILNETSGELRTRITLDREDSSVHYLYVKASNDKLNITTLQPLARKRRAVADPANSNTTNTTQAPLPDDLTVQLVEIEVGDTNDNGPQFTKTLYTGGVTDSAKPGSNILRVTAIDKDFGNNSRIAYTIRPGKDSDKFSMDMETGWILAQVSYAGKTGQEYVLDVMAADNFGQTPYFNDTATVKLYVLTDKQRAVIISTRLPSELRSVQDELIRVLQNVTGYIINIDDINYWKDPKTGNYDRTRTEVTFHAIDPITKKIIDSDEVISKVDKYWINHRLFFEEWEIKKVERKVPVPLTEEFPWMLAIVIGLSVLLFLLILIFCCVVCQLRRRNKAEEAQLYAARARSFTSPQSYGNPVDKTDNAPFDSSIIDMIEANASCPEYLHTRSSSNPGYHGSPVRLTNSEPTESSTDMIEEYGNSQHIEERLRNARHVPLPGLNGNPVDGSNARETRSNERLQAPPTLYLDANGNGAVGRYGNDSRSHPGSYGNPVYNNNRATIIRNSDPRSARETDDNDVRLVTMEYRKFLRLPTMNGNPVDRSAPQNTENYRNYRNYRYVATGYPSGNYPLKRYPTKGYPSTIPELFEGPLEEDDLSVNSSSSEMTINTSTRDIAVDFQTKRWVKNHGKYVAGVVIDDTKL